MTSILGIRHHGPGSARSLLAALESIRPEVLLLEGPPDADDLIVMARHEEMRPPVALLVYRPDSPNRAVFYPFAEFSPEWVGIRWALANNVPVRFIDLPQCYQMVEETRGGETEEEESDDEEIVEVESGVIESRVDESVKSDPFSMIARAAGYSDSERWWEEQFEKEHGGLEAFDAVLELMTALREGAEPPSLHEGRREAWMRQRIRDAEREGHERIAVVCGAWHAPALATMPTAKSDADLLKGMPKATVAATWLPWTNRRLTFASGYGAGVNSPGYYSELWNLKDRSSLVARWMTRVAHLLRDEDLEGSTASIIEATRLAEATAMLRERRTPGLEEFNEAAQAVFCFGDSTALALIHNRLIVGDLLGTVPADAPQVPLQRDFQSETRKLRMKVEAIDKSLDLDLRTPNDLERSHLFHRLNLLGVGWASGPSSGGKGTFRETWQLRWEPEFEVRLIEAAPWGNTIVEAATNAVVARAAASPTLADLTSLVQHLLLADLPAAVERVMVELENRAALTSDVSHLMSALPPLASVLRYGNVRRTDASAVGHIVSGLVARICAGLLPACSSLNDEAAATMLDRIDGVQTALSTLDDPSLLDPWRETLGRLDASETLHGLLAGRATRLLLDSHILVVDDVAVRVSRRLSRATPPTQAGAWLEGFLGGSGTVLLHHPEIWSLLDTWVGSLSAEHFVDVLPLLRRTFARFSHPERRQMGELAQRGGTASVAVLSTGVDEPLDEARANRLLPTLLALIGAEQTTP